KFSHDIASACSRRPRGNAAPKWWPNHAPAPHWRAETSGFAVERGLERGFESGIASVFSDQQERPTVVASDPQRGVGLDQTPLRVLATTARTRRSTSAAI